jgi:hypothetical protein
MDIGASRGRPFPVSEQAREQGIFEFDLSPVDAEFISRFFHDRTEKG